MIEVRDLVTIHGDHNIWIVTHVDDNRVYVERKEKDDDFVWRFRVAPKSVESICKGS